MPHHGSKFSSSIGFLEKVAPKISVIEVGKNSYGHPTADALERIKEIGSLIFRTDQDGLLKMVFDNGKIDVMNLFE